MASSEAESGELNYYANVIGVRPSFLAREKLLTEEELQKLEASEDMTILGERSSIKRRLEEVKERIYGNIDKLDYLRGISNLEKNFTNLMEEILHTALTLSKTNSVSQSKHVFNECMDEKVEQCWKYITQLTDAVQWHVMHASRYHKFHHDVQTAQMELTNLTETSKNLVDSLSPPNKLDCNALSRVERAIRAQVNKLSKLASIARQLNIQARAVAPLHYRKRLPPGRHSANLLASIRLPQGAWLHRGDPVHVWANNRVASDLLHEWAAETIDGEQTATLPAPCLWLTSPETSPVSSMRGHASRIAIYTEQPGENDNKAENGQKEKSLEVNLKRKRTLDLFSNNKALAAKFQKDLFSTWADAIGDIAVCLMPTYRAIMKCLVDIEGDLPATMADELSELKSGLQPIVEYGDGEMQALLNKLKLKPINNSFLASEVTVTQSELHQMVQTLDAWNKLRSQLLEAKRAASVRSLSQTALNQTSNISLSKRFHSFDTRRVSSLQGSSSPHQMGVTRMQSTDYEISQMDELVTSFADPAPRTFRVLEDGNAEYIDVSQSPTVKVGTENVILPLKRTQSQTAPVRQCIETKDLMTQINTPYLPTLVHCPKCDQECEVDLYRSSADFITTSLQGELSGLKTGPEGSFHWSPKAIYLNHRASSATQHFAPVKFGKVRSADSMPVLSGAQEPKYITADSSLSSRSRTIEPAVQRHKRFGRLVKHRPHSFSTTTTAPTTPGLNETTASSGIESLPDTSIKDQSKKKIKRGTVRKETDKHVSKSSGISLFRWGKKRKPAPESQSPGTESLITEPGPPGRRSPLLMYQPSPLHVHTHLERPDSNTTLTDQDTPQPNLATPILRSRSWVQHGTPWGYGPPSNDRWQPSTEYMISQERPQTHYTQSHSERLKIGTSRPRLGGERFFSTVESDRSFSVDYSSANQLIDSGIQTDTDLAPGLSDLDTTIQTRKSDTVCAPRHTKLNRGLLLHSAIQCGRPFSHLNQVGVNVDLLKRECSSFGCQVETENIKPKMKPSQLWDVSCQVGLMQKSQSMAVDMHDFLTEDIVIPGKNVVTQADSQPQPRVDKIVSLIDKSSHLQHSPLMFSVSCQIGQIVRTTASGPDHMEAVQMLDENIGKFEQSIVEGKKLPTSPVCMKLGKKLQVGKSWLEEAKVHVSVEQKEAAVNTVDEVDVKQKHFVNINSIHKAPVVDDYTQTWITGDVIPCKRPVHDRSFQTFTTQIDASDNKQSSVRIEFDFASKQNAAQQKGDIKAIPLLCPKVTSYVQATPKFSDVSTLVGRQMTAIEQQTEEPEINQHADIEKIGISGVSDSNPADPSSTLNGYSSPLSQTAISIDIEPKANELSKASVCQKPMLCPKCGFVVESTPPVSTRSKRIQKGSPKLLPNVTFDPGMVNGPNVSNESTDMGTQSRESRQRRGSHSLYTCEQPRVVLDIGFIGFRKCDRQNRLPSYSRHIPTQLNADDISEKSTTSSGTSEVDDDVVPVCERNINGHSHHGRCISMPAGSVRMCFHLDQSGNYSQHQAPARRWVPYSQQRKRGACGNGCPRTQKSWSVDDLRKIEQQWDQITLEETDVKYTCMPEQDRRRLQVGHCPGLERGASGARRRIDQLKQRHEQYQYYY